MTSIALPAGFQSAGMACGIKRDPQTFDLALFVSDRPAAGAGVFTQNRVCGAPVKVSRQRVPSDSIRAVVINSGNANACTGPRGVDDARWMTALVAGRLGCEESDVLVCSTGVIGRFLPRDKLEVGLPQVAAKLSSAPETFADAARGMLTTDTFPKQSTRSVQIGGKTVRVSGVAKGAAMIGPNMATMLSVIMTDAELPVFEADYMLRAAIERTFNCISVEGHTSTSDSVLLLANGAAGAGPLGDADKRQVQAMIHEVCEELSQAIVRDAEGAAHFIVIEVKGCRSSVDAFRIAQTIANDALVKTAIAGNDPNWGRIVSCAGRTGVELTEEDISLRINDTLIFDRGTPAAYDERSVSNALRDRREVLIELELPFGTDTVRFWTSDLTAEYVRLNSEYTT